MKHFEKSICLRLFQNDKEPAERMDTRLKRSTVSLFAISKVRKLIFYRNPNLQYICKKHKSESFTGCSKVRGFFVSVVSNLCRSQGRQE